MVVLVVVFGVVETSAAVDRGCTHNFWGIILTMVTEVHTYFTQKLSFENNYTLNPMDSPMA